MRWAEPNCDDVFDLREVVVEHRADIFRYARSFCRNDADAEDLAQNAVLRALPRGRGAQPRAGQVVPAADRAQPRHRPGARPAPHAGRTVRRAPRRGADDPAPTPASCTTTSTSSAPVFADLPRFHQEVLHLRFVEDLDHAAIVAWLETTEQAACQRVHRAMQALRAITQQRQLGLDNP